MLFNENRMVGLCPAYRCPTGLGGMSASFCPGRGHSPDCISLIFLVIAAKVRDRRVRTMESRSICWRCRFHRRVESGKGSIFLLCELPLCKEDDPRLEPLSPPERQYLASIQSRWPKYPPQPMNQCPYFILSTDLGTASSEQD
jgi:hypothetical protein